MRLALALPVVQVIVAAALEFNTPPPDLEAPPPLVRQICWGVNAPALIVRAVGRVLDVVLPVGHTIPIDELCILAGVFLLWYLVGRALDRRIAGLPVVPQGRKGLVVLGLLFLLGLDLGLNALGMQIRLGGRTTWVLLLGAWSVILMVGSVRGMTAQVRREKRGTA